MSQKDKVLRILEISVQILHLGLDILDPKVKAIPLHKYQQIQNLAKEISKEAQDLP